MIIRASRHHQSYMLCHVDEKKKSLQFKLSTSFFMHEHTNTHKPIQIVHCKKQITSNERKNGPLCIFVWLCVSQQCVPRVRQVFVSSCQKHFENWVNLAQDERKSSLRTHTHSTLLLDVIGHSTRLLYLTLFSFALSFTRLCSVVVQMLTRRNSPTMACSSTIQTPGVTGSALRRIPISRSTTCTLVSYTHYTLCSEKLQLTA